MHLDTSVSMWRHCPSYVNSMLVGAECCPLADWLNWASKRVERHCAWEIREEAIGEQLARFNTDAS